MSVGPEVEAIAPAPRGLSTGHRQVEPCGSLRGTAAKTRPTLQSGLPVRPPPHRSTPSAAPGSVRLRAARSAKQRPCEPRRARHLGPLDWLRGKRSAGTVRPCCRRRSTRSQPSPSAAREQPSSTAGRSPERRHPPGALPSRPRPQAQAGSRRFRVSVEGLCGVVQYG